MGSKNSNVRTDYLKQLKHGIASGISETECDQTYSTELVINLTSKFVKEEIYINKKEEEQCTVKDKILDPLDIHFDELIRKERNIDPPYAYLERYVVQRKADNYSKIHQNEVKQENIDEFIIEKGINQQENTERSNKQMCNEPVTTFNSDLAELKEEEENIYEEVEVLLDEMEEEFTIKEETLGDTRNEYLNIKCEVSGRTDTNIDYHHTAEPINNVNNLVSDNISADIKCNICSMLFTYREDLNAHLHIHTSKHYFECLICKKKLPISMSLKTHMKTHTSEKKFQCAICEKKYAMRGDMREHMRIHSGEKNYQCAVCEKRFSNTIDIKKHMRIHSEEKKRQCTVCKKVFTRSSSVGVHMQIHTGEQKYQCTVCEKRFNRSSNMRQHMRLHPGE